MQTIEEQVKAGWRLYYKLISDGDMCKAKEVFDRTAALLEARHARKTTQNILRQVTA